MSENAPRELTLETRASIADIPKSDWQQLAGVSNPFLRYEFFQSLEESGCARTETGWTPSHLVFKHEAGLWAWHPPT